MAEDLSGRLLRLPFFYEIAEGEQLRVIEELKAFLETVRILPDQLRPVIGVDH